MTTAPSSISSPAIGRGGHAGERRFLRRFWPVLVAAVVVAAVIVGALRYRAAHTKPAVHLESSVVDEGPLTAKVIATGTVSALVTVQVGSQVSGRIDTLLVDFESVVKKGQTIATIEPSLFKAAVAQARANLAAARAAVETAQTQRLLAERNQTRNRVLYDESLLSKADFDASEAALGAAEANVTSARAGIAQAQAALDQAELNLRYTTIVSPIDGIVISRNVDVGQTVAATLQAPTLFTIAQDVTRMQVDTNVAEGDVGKIRAGMPVTFTVDAHAGRTFPGTVRQVRENAQTIQNVVTYDAVIDVDNRERLLMPGMTASVAFAYATREKALRVPNAALRFRPDAATLALARRSDEAGAGSGHVVWVVSGEAIEKRTLKLGVSDGVQTEVLGGDLHPGDRVVVESTSEAAGARKP